MKLITDLIGKLSHFRDNINTYMEAITMDAEDTIIDMNISQMYDKGERRTGEKITPEYAPATVQIKKKKGQPTNRVTLRDTFAFQSSIWVQYYVDSFEIKADDWKTEQLVQKYGEEILGLQDSMVKILVDNFYRPSLLNELKKQLGYE